MIKVRRLAWLSLIVLNVLSAAGTSVAAESPAEIPRVLDPRLVVERFAEAPAIVHPIALEFDGRGRLLVIESHTHFRPANYQGPPADRVRLVEDTDGDGKADRFGTFFEGTRYSMDLALHPDGSVYLATRNEILRLRDNDGDGKAEESKRVVFLETAGNYPHNGLSGLVFDAKGNLVFGMGENLGADYTLRGSDGLTISGGGEGGGVFACSTSGEGLRRLATGFWNPFGICVDIYGRMFAVDNDPDSMPPCRLLHVVKGGDYGYQFRYGRSGRHVFQAWNGELPGTLPMVAGTGEAPCEVMSYESDGLPREYLGNLLVTAWADHRIDRYVLKERGASVTSDPQPLVRGGKDFRPSGMTTAPDGSLYVGDWVLRDYALHGKGNVWRIRAKDATAAERPKEPKLALLSGHRPVREAAARTLAADDAGRDFLRSQQKSDDARVRATSLAALITAGERDAHLVEAAEKDSDVGIRMMAVRALATRGPEAKHFLEPQYPSAVRREAIAALRGEDDLPKLLPLLRDMDPFVRSAAVYELARDTSRISRIDVRTLSDPGERVGFLLALRESEWPGAIRFVGAFLNDSEGDARLLAVKWIADDKLASYRRDILRNMRAADLSTRMYSAYATALARLDNQDVNDAKMADAFFGRVIDERTPTALRVGALQLVPAGYSKLTVDVLSKLIEQQDPTLQLEAVRALCESPAPQRFTKLLETARDTGLAEGVRAQAIVGLAEQAVVRRDDLLRIALEEKATLRDEALRALVGVKLAPEQRAMLEELGKRQPEATALIDRVLGKPLTGGRPALSDTDVWVKRLEGPANAEAGRRVFFHSNLAGCFRCHRVEGRGRDIGPDLSTIGRTDKRRLLESILQPSNEIGPSYQNWQIATEEGKVVTGILVKTDLDRVTYLDAKGELFTLSTTDIAERRPLPLSIMPAGLADLLTDQELRDVLAYLAARR